MRAVTFDFWGTLFRDRDGDLRHDIRTAALAEAAGAAPEDASRALREVMAEFFRRHLADADLRWRRLPGKRRRDMY